VVEADTHHRYKTTHLVEVDPPTNYQRKSRMSRMVYSELRLHFLIANITAVYLRIFTINQHKTLVLYHVLFWFYAIQIPEELDDKLT
jgi:hypothetical protein